jgi:glycosyltransferase involved in cell wall biosynthesis
MKISIITVCYNSAATIADTIMSISKQTYPNIEYIVVDGLSKDNTVEIIQKNEGVISKWISEKDNGIYDAMNKGIAMATGDVIGILNADDVYADNNVLDDVMKAFNDETISGVYGDLKYVQQNDLSKVIRFWKSGTYRPGKFLEGWMPPHPTFYVRKKVYDEFGVFRTDMPSASDYEFMLRVIHVKNIKLAYIPKVFVLMREGGLSNRSLQHRLNANRDDRRAWTVNGVQPKFYTLLMKPLSKILQFIFKD